MVDEGSAKRVSHESRTIEPQRIQNVAEMFDQRVYRVLITGERFVGKAVSLEVHCDDAEAGVGQHRHVAVIRVDGAAPARNENYRRSTQIPPLYRPNPPSRPH